MQSLRNLANYLCLAPSFWFDNLEEMLSYFDMSSTEIELYAKYDPHGHKVFVFEEQIPGCRKFTKDYIFEHTDHILNLANKKQLQIAKNVLRKIPITTNSHIFPLLMRINALLQQDDELNYWISQFPVKAQQQPHDKIQHNAPLEHKEKVKQKFAEAKQEFLQLSVGSQQQVPQKIQQQASIEHDDEFNSKLYNDYIEFKFALEKTRNKAKGIIEAFETLLKSERQIVESTLSPDELIVYSHLKKDYLRLLKKKTFENCLPETHRLVDVGFLEHGSLSIGVGKEIRTGLYHVFAFDQKEMKFLWKVPVTSIAKIHLCHFGIVIFRENKSKGYVLEPQKAKLIFIIKFPFKVSRADSFHLTKKNTCYVQGDNGEVFLGKIDNSKRFQYIGHVNAHKHFTGFNEVIYFKDVIETSYVFQLCEKTQLPVLRVFPPTTKDIFYLENHAYVLSKLGKRNYLRKSTESSLTSAHDLSKIEPICNIPQSYIPVEVIDHNIVLYNQAEKKYLVLDLSQEMEEMIFLEKGIDSYPLEFLLKMSTAMEQRLRKEFIRYMESNHKLEKNNELKLAKELAGSIRIKPLDSAGISVAAKEILQGNGIDSHLVPIKCPKGMVEIYAQGEVDLRRSEAFICNGRIIYSNLVNGNDEEMHDAFVFIRNQIAKSGAPPDNPTVICNQLLNLASQATLGKVTTDLLKNLLDQRDSLSITNIRRVTAIDITPDCYQVTQNILFAISDSQMNRADGAIIGYLPFKMTIEIPRDQIKSIPEIKSIPKDSINLSSKVEVPEMLLDLEQGLRKHFQLTAQILSGEELHLAQLKQFPKMLNYQEMDNLIAQLETSLEFKKYEENVKNVKDIIGACKNAKADDQVAKLRNLYEMINQWLKTYSGSNYSITIFQPPSADKFWELLREISQKIEAAISKELGLQKIRQPKN